MYFRRAAVLVLLSSAPLFAQHNHGNDRTGVAQPAPALKRVGTISHPVATRNAEAQRYFNQGIAMLYAFNHLESERSFTYAAQLDPKLPIAYWGVALALGSNINDPITPDREQHAANAIKRAIALRRYANKPERDYIDALAKRYIGDGDRAAKDRAYSDAMGRLAAKYPNDPDAATLYADSLMNLMPWDYYNPDGTPKPEIAKAIAALERVMKRWPSHTGSNHLYIHAVEASSNPDRGVTSADKLGRLAPAAGHLVHMPAHIYMRVGRYADASTVNEQAVLADEDYISQCNAQGVYPVAYYPHNIHFLTYASMMEGRSKAAIENAHKLRSKLPADMKDVPPWGNSFTAVPYFALARFGQWDAILAEPQPGIAGLEAATALWHYARGLAFVRTGKLPEAQQERAALEQLASDPKVGEQPLGMNNAVKVMPIALHVLDGEIAESQHDYDKAIAEFQAAAKLQDGLRYNEPEDWYFPVRQSLGAVLLEAGRFKEAEDVYREDLKRNRENGWSLFGLTASLKRQQRFDEAGQTAQRFAKAWSRADIELKSSRF
jgi:tetratricopeptide (TPR) repeat protein